MASQPHINVSATSVAAPAAPPTAPSQHPMVAELSRKAARPLSLQTMAKTYEDGDVMVRRCVTNAPAPRRRRDDAATTPRRRRDDAATANHGRSVFGETEAFSKPSQTQAAAAYLHEELPVRLAKQVAEVRRALGGDAEGVAPYYEATLLDLLRADRAELVLALQQSSRGRHRCENQPERRSRGRDRERATPPQEAENRARAAGIGGRRRQTPKPDDAPSERAFGQKVEGLLAETKSAIPHALAQAVRARRAAAFASFVADGGGAVCANPARSAPDAPAEARKDFHLSRPERLARLALDRDLERFFTARVGIRLLAEHYLAVRDADAAPLISACRPADIAEAAAAEVSELARRASLRRAVLRLRRDRGGRPRPRRRG